VGKNTYKKEHDTEFNGYEFLVKLLFVNPSKSWTISHTILLTAPN